MGTLKNISAPMQVNPVKLSQPMGATMAFLGVERCMPLLHGGQGCASFIKVYLTRHFSEPIALQTTAVTDVTAVLDGGDYSIVEAVKQVTAKVDPALVGLCTTGLTETKGDDIRRVAAQVRRPLVHANTPDYEGGLERGWASACTALIRQLCQPATSIEPDKVVLLPHVSMQPIEVESVKEFIASFGYEVLALPDLSTSLDGHLGEKQAALSDGGICVEEIKNLATAAMVLSIGASMQPCAAALLEKNAAIRHHHISHLGGLVATDALVELLLQARPYTKVPARVSRWRARLQDAMLDSHFSLGQTDVAVVAEPDQLLSLCQVLHEAGGRVRVALSPVDSPALQQVPAERVLVGDLETLEQYQDTYTLVVGNFHCERMAHHLGQAMVVRGFPNWEQVGNQLKDDLLYAGSSAFLCECANAASLQREHAEHAHSAA